MKGASHAGSSHARLLPQCVSAACTCMRAACMRGCVDESCLHVQNCLHERSCLHERPARACMRAATELPAGSSHARLLPRAPCMRACSCATTKPVYARALTKPRYVSGSSCMRACMRSLSSGCSPGSRLLCVCVLHITKPVYSGKHKIVALKKLRVFFVFSFIWW
jgi:hypothetical protein